MPDPREYVAGSSSLVMGCDSYTQSAELADNELIMGQNIVVRGGIAQTRPGSRTVFCLPDGNFQGCTLFTPANGVAQQVFVVDGLVYVSAAPFTSYRRLFNLRFSNTAKFIAWAVCLKSTDYDADGNLISLANPYSVLMMQDGLTRAAYWDGGNSGHLDPASPPVPDETDNLPGYNETPIGLWMIWSGNRLWVSRNNQLFASDIGNPLKFTESLYLNEARAFYLSAPCTGMIEVPSGNGEDKGFIAFTENDGTLFQSYIQDRTQWLETPLFQNTVLPNTGCVAPRSLVTQYGLNWWFSSRGLTNMNAAFRQNLSSRLDYQDNQMFSSKAYLSPDLSGVCGSYYENYLMMSVPFCDIYNRHTWTLDQAPFENNAPAWTGFWSGWRPIEWCRGLVNGDDRVFFGSVDYDGKNRIWEAMLPDRTDNGCPITCFAQLRDHAAGNLDQKRYEWSKFFLSQISGDVDLNVYVASTKGGYQLQKEYHLVATQGQVFGDVQYSESGPYLMGNRVQSRTIRTPADPDDNECNQCGVESKVGNMIDYAFSHLLIWSGQMGIRAYQIHMRESPERQGGDCEEDEVGPRTLNAQGCSGLELLVPTQIFETFEAFAEGTARTSSGADIYISYRAISPISQANAQSLAECGVNQIIARLNDTEIAAGVYGSQPAEIGGGETYVVVNSLPRFTAPVETRLLLVGGGGGGGIIFGAGGGAGGVVIDDAFSLSTMDVHAIVVGAGGAGSAGRSGIPSDCAPGSNGQDTTFDDIVAYGGGGGGSYSDHPGLDGGCGGGSQRFGAAGLGVVGQGYNGGPGGSGNDGGGGGGAGQIGGGSEVHTGGNGVSSDISGASVIYGGGGSGATSFPGIAYAGGAGGGGHNGWGQPADPGTHPAGYDGTDGLGGGGGGGNYTNLPASGGNGGKGVAIVSYSGEPRFTGGTITSSGGRTIHTFTSSGNLSPL